MRLSYQRQLRSPPSLRYIVTHTFLGGCRSGCDCSLFRPALHKLSPRTANCMALTASYTTARSKRRAPRATRCSTPLATLAGGRLRDLLSLQWIKRPRIAARPSMLAIDGRASTTLSPTSQVLRLGAPRLAQDDVGYRSSGLMPFNLSYCVFVGALCGLA
jgi:hypothetical protein